MMKGFFLKSFPAVLSFFLPAGFLAAAARNVEGRVILYGDIMTESMEKAITETNRRRALQKAYNEANGITPETVRSSIREVLEITRQVTETLPPEVNDEEVHR